jgi:hypothetical protein
MLKRDIITKIKDYEEILKDVKAVLKQILLTDVELKEGESLVDWQRRKIMELYFSLED